MSETAAVPDGAVQGRSWDLSTEYPAADAPEVAADLAALERLIDDIEERNGTLTLLIEHASELTPATAAAAIADARAVHVLIEQARELAKLRRRAAAPGAIMLQQQGCVRVQIDMAPAR